MARAARWWRSCIVFTYTTSLTHHAQLAGGPVHDLLHRSPRSKNPTISVERWRIFYCNSYVKKAGLPASHVLHRCTADTLFHQIFGTSHRLRRHQKKHVVGLLAEFGTNFRCDECRLARRTAQHAASLTPPLPHTGPVILDAISRRDARSPKPFAARPRNCHITHLRRLCPRPL